MARYTDAKCRLCRQRGVKLFLKGSRCYSSKCPLEKRGAVPPGQHGQKGRWRRRLSGYGEQLGEKQKVRRIYGVLERQFRKYFKKAMKAKRATGKVLLQLLETRLDNIVYRLGFVSSRSAARQLVSHGHILVDGKKVMIPSYQVKPGQVINLTPKAFEMNIVKESLSEKDRIIPDWLKRKALAGTISRLPEKEEIEADIDEKLIVEFYSR